MTRSEALEALGLPSDADAATVRRRYGEVHGEYQVRLTNAPTPALQKLYRDKLAALQAAERMLLGESGSAGYSDLPALAPVLDSTEPRHAAHGYQTATWSRFDSEGAGDEPVSRKPWVLVAGLLALGFLGIGVVYARVSSARETRAAEEERIALARADSAAAAEERSRDSLIALTAQQIRDSIVAAEEDERRAAAESAARRQREAAAAPEPTFTPMTRAPSLVNGDEVSRTLMREYPALLRDAGIGGRTMLWLFINDDGVVEQARVNQSSGFAQLDDAALRVARTMRFTPAMNEDEFISVWVQMPIAFSVGT